MEGNLDYGKQRTTWDATRTPREDLNEKMGFYRPTHTDHEVFVTAA